MDYIWIISAASIVLVLIAFQKKEDRYRHLQSIYQDSQSRQKMLSDRARDAEEEREQIQRENMRLAKWKRRSEELEIALRETKRSEWYMSSKRRESSDDQISNSLRRGTPGTKFVGTLSGSRTSTFADRLEEMIRSADFEVLIVSPWIKGYAWDRMSAHLDRFARHGGSLKVFTRADPSDYASGLADDISKEVEGLGGELVRVSQLHAKIYVADRKEAIVASANLTRGGLESNCESGVWLNDPIAVGEICEFIDDLRRLSR